MEPVRDTATKARFDPSDRIAFKATTACLEEGLIVRALPGDTSAICPPRVIGKDGIGELASKLATTLDRTAAGI